MPATRRWMSSGRHDAASVDAPRLLTTLAEMLLGRGADRTAPWAIVTGDANWLRARHARRRAVQPAGSAHSCDQIGPPRHAAAAAGSRARPGRSRQGGRARRSRPYLGRAAPRMCLVRQARDGGDAFWSTARIPNTNVYAASSRVVRRPTSGMTPRWSRCSSGTAHGSSCLRRCAGTHRSCRQIAGRRRSRPDARRLATPGSIVAADLLWGAIERPSPEIVRMALDRIDWPRDDARWHSILQNGLYPGPEEQSAGASRRLSAGARRPGSKRAQQAGRDALALRRGLARRPDGAAIG